MFLARNSALCCVRVIGERFTLALSKSWENFIYMLASTWQPSASYNPLIKICLGYVIWQISVQNPSSGFPNKISQAFSNKIKKKKNSHGGAKMDYLEDWNAVRDTFKHNLQYHWNEKRYENLGEFFAMTDNMKGKSYFIGPTRVAQMWF